jgi:GntR family transcriptional regulator
MPHPKPSSLFIQVVNTIKARIDAGEYKPGDFLPAYKDIADDLGVSMITVRKAMDILAEEGRIISKQGVRARVAEPSEELFEIEINKGYSPWVEITKGKKRKHKAKLLDRSLIDCPVQTRQLLRLSPNVQVERLRRVFIMDDKPIVYLVNYARADFMSRIPTSGLLSTSFIESFQEYTGVKFEEMEQRIQAVIADIDLGKILNINFGSPLIFVQNIYFDTNDTPIAISHMHYHADHFVYTIKRDLTNEFS